MLNSTKTYRYSAIGQRTVKQNSINDIEYYLDDVILDADGKVKSYQTSEGYAVPYEDNGTTTVSYYYNVTDWLGTTRGVLDENGNTLNAADHYPYGLRMSGRAFISDVEGNRYQFTGHEHDGETGYDYHGARYYNRELGRYMSIDPLAHLAPSWNPYRYGFNNPIRYIDPDGRFEGDYYDKDGIWLGSDNKDDNKVYYADENGNVTFGVGALNKTQFTDLGITHTEFRKQAATVYAESSAYKMNTVTDDLKKEMFAIASVHQKNSLAFGVDNNKAIEYLSLTPSTINSSKFKTTANAAIINALSGGFDYSYGATMWDGAEQGLFPETNNDKSVFHKGKSFELHMNTMGWNISDDHFKTWKSNVGSSFIAPQQKAAPSNYGSYQNKGMMRLQSTAVYGETIFWKIK
jgi:RHS repeat-associated protein